MTPKQAAMVFRQFGVSSEELSTPAGIRAARNRLLMLTHSDLTQGDDAAAKRLNVAYDVLKQLEHGYYELGSLPADTTTQPPLPGSFYDRRRRAPGAAAKRADRRATGATVLPASDDEAAEPRAEWQEEYDVFFYDGQLRPPIVVVGSPSTYPAMAEAVRAVVGPSRGFGHRAVLVRSKREATLTLIHLNGRDLPEPVTLPQPCLCEDPKADVGFVYSLPAQLAWAAGVRSAGTGAAQAASDQPGGAGPHPLSRQATSRGASLA